MDKQLRILCGAIVTESKLSKESKLQLLKFIQKEATDTQIKALLLDGKILTRIDEHTEEIISDRFEVFKENHSLFTEDVLTGMAVIMLGGMALAVTAATWRAYRKLRGMFQEKSRRCGTYSIGSDRTACLITIKMDEANHIVAMLKKAMADCSKQKDPDRCKAKIKLAIAKQMKIAAAKKAKLDKMALHGKQVAQGKERARRKGTHVTI